MKVSYEVLDSAPNPIRGYPLAPSKLTQDSCNMIWMPDIHPKRVIKEKDNV